MKRRERISSHDSGGNVATDHHLTEQFRISQSPISSRTPRTDFWGRTIQYGPPEQFPVSDGKPRATQTMESVWGPCRGIYLGRALMLDGFKVDIDADVVRPLTPGARNLYLALRWLADGCTGEVSRNGEPFSAKYICEQAKISEDSWQKYLRELREAGLVTVAPERRNRALWKTPRYTVHRQPVANKNGKKPMFRPGREFPVAVTGTGISRPKYSETPSGSSLRDSPSLAGQSETGKNVNHHHPTADDDEKFSSPEPNHYERIQDQATAFLIGKGHDPDFVEIGIQFVEARSVQFGGTPVAAHYYIHSFLRLLENDNDKAVVWALVDQKRKRREKYMPGFTGKLTVDEEQRRQQFNEILEQRMQKKTG